MAIILHAGSPGAFIDLAADLAWFTARPLSGSVVDQHPTIRARSLNGGQLPGPSAVCQATGVLIGRDDGHFDIY